MVTKTALSRAAGIGKVIALCALFATASFFVTQRLLDRTEPRPKDVIEGQLLENVELVSHVGDDPRRVVPLHEIFGTDCGVMIFFLSTCPYCEEMAPDWSGVERIATNAGEVRVVWTVVTGDDAGAAAFVRRHGLAQPWYALRTRGDRRKLGVTGWPTPYLISAGGRFEKEIVTRDPKALVAGLESCSS